MQIELTAEMQEMIKEIMGFANTGNEVYKSFDQVLLDGLVVLRRQRKAEFDTFMAMLDERSKGERIPMKDVMSRLKDRSESHTLDKE